MKKMSTPLKIIVHVLAWAILFFLNYVFLLNYSIEINYAPHIAALIIHIIIFYTTYYVLMPLFFGKKIFIFVCLSVFLITTSIVTKEYVMDLSIEMMRKQEILHKKTDHRIPPPIQNKKTRRSMENRRLIFGSYSLVLIYLLGFSFKLVQQWQYDEKQKLAFEKEKIETELSFLKQQINPHFLFNSLNSIYSLAISKSDLTTGAILKLSGILRYILYESEKHKVNLRNELKTIEDYIELQKLRLTDKVKVNFEVTDKSENYKIEPLLLIPLIENAFKHGIDNVNESFINISINIIGEKLQMLVSNKIVDQNKERKSDSGIGIKNIKRRLDILYQSNYCLNISKDDYIFTVDLQIKLTN